jgi:hypothetical protein
MSSIEPELEALLRSFFRERIVPAAERLRESGGVSLASTRDASAASYYHRRDDGGTYVEVLDPDRMVERLREIMADEPEMLSLAEPLIALAVRLKQFESREEDVSPFVYAMF